MANVMNFSELIQGIMTIGDREGLNGLSSVVKMLSTYPDLKSEAIGYCSGLELGERETLLSASTERSTHYKWCLASSGHRRTRIWLHLYKEWNGRVNDFAASIHDHRYSFASAVLYGSLWERRWLLGEQGKVWPKGLIEYRSGNVYSIDSSEIHSIENVASGTLTLVVQLAASKSTSSVYNRESRKVELQIPDLEELFDRMIYGFE